MFSILLAKTLPLLSQATQHGSCEGKAKMIGPMISAGASAVTQLSSSRPDPVGFEIAGWLKSSLEEITSSVSETLRFLDFFSPLNCKGFTIANEGKEIETVILI